MRKAHEYIHNQIRDNNDWTNHAIWWHTPCTVNGNSWRENKKNINSMFGFLLLCTDNALVYFECHVVLHVILDFKRFVLLTWPWRSVFSSIKAQVRQWTPSAKLDHFNGQANPCTDRFAYQFLPQCIWKTFLFCFSPPLCYGVWLRSGSFLSRFNNCSLYSS